jgi:hypothetical protein
MEDVVARPSFWERLRTLDLSSPGARSGSKSWKRCNPRDRSPPQHALDDDTPVVHT